MGDGLKRARDAARATRQTPGVPQRLDIRHLRNHAVRAITERLGYRAPDALRAVERDGDTVIIRVNSGGNALAIEPYLRQRGYRAEYAGGNPDGYGCAVRVSLREPATEDDR